MCLTSAYSLRRIASADNSLMLRLSVSPKGHAGDVFLLNTLGSVRSVDLWFMSRNATVSYRPTHTPHIPGDQPTGDAAVSALPPGVSA